MKTLAEVPHKITILGNVSRRTPTYRGTCICGYRSGVYPYTLQGKMQAAYWGKEHLDRLPPVGLSYREGRNWYYRNELRHSWYKMALMLATDERGMGD